MSAIRCPVGSKAQNDDLAWPLKGVSQSSVFMTESMLLSTVPLVPRRFEPVHSSDLLMVHRMHTGLAPEPNPPFIHV
jgi:hypothetical protein